MNKVHIIGAGMSGLLAANMLRFRATVFEKQSSLPNNHSALLRFRSNVFGTAIGIPFREVKMIKGVYGDNSNPIKNMLQYSMKVTGQARTDRSLMQGFIQEKRYIAPRDLIPRMSEGVDIRYNSILMMSDESFDCPIISTIPMPDLMKILDYPHRDKVKFQYRSGINITAVIENCDAYATFYYPSGGVGAYRASITGDQLIIEYVDDPERIKWIEEDTNANVNFYASHFGFSVDQIHGIELKKQAYAKILPIDDEIRKDFMHWATDRHGVYSLGRYATWRPSVMLDDLVQDVNLISNWVQKGGKYGAARHRAQGSLL